MQVVFFELVICRVYWQSIQKAGFTCSRHGNTTVLYSSWWTGTKPSCVVVNWAPIHALLTSTIVQRMMLSNTSFGLSTVRTLLLLYNNNQWCSRVYSVRVQSARSDRMSKRLHLQSKLKLYNNVLNFINRHLCNSPHQRYTVYCQKDNSDTSQIPKRTK